MSDESEAVYALLRTEISEAAAALVSISELADRIYERGDQPKLARIARVIFECRVNRMEGAINALWGNP